MYVYVRLNLAKLVFCGKGPSYSTEELFFKNLVLSSILPQTMFTSIFKTNLRNLSHSSIARSAYSIPKPVIPVSAIKKPAQEVQNLNFLKFDSNGLNDLYAICRIYNIPFLVTKGDKIILPYKIKNHEVGDVLKLGNVTTIGSRNFTYNKKDGIPQSEFKLTATLTEITKEPKYYVYKKKPRCRRLKTVEVEPFQTHLVIDELKLS